MSIPFQVNVRMPTLTQIMDSLSDDKSLALFNTIAISGGSGNILITRLNLTRKQYYSKISKMIKSGLIRRSHGRLLLTTFGKIIYEAHLTMGRAIECYWKLKAVDSLEVKEIPAEHYGELVQAITGHAEIASFITKNML
jgi:predicted transcriptional regulator